MHDVQGICGGIEEKTGCGDGKVEAIAGESRWI